MKISVFEQHLNIDSLNSIFTGRVISLDNLTERFLIDFLNRSSDTVVSDLHRKDVRGRSLSEIKKSVENGALCEVAIAQILSEIPNVVTEFGAPTDYGFDLIVIINQQRIKIEVKKMNIDSSFVSFSSYHKYSNVEHSGINNMFDLLIACKTGYNNVVPWAAVSSEAFKHKCWTFSKESVKDFYGNVKLDEYGRPYKGKYIQDKNASNLGYFKWLNKI